MNKRNAGFTIVELLIVIVVIAILAAISIVAFSGIQERARDSRREAAVNTITRALEMYHLDNGGYPDCAGGTYQAGGTRSSCFTTSPAFINALSPEYIAEVPQDPTGGDSRFRYIFGSKKLSATTYTGDASDNYILGVAYEGRGNAYVEAWGPPHTYLAGSSN